MLKAVDYGPQYRQTLTEPSSGFPYGGYLINFQLSETFGFPGSSSRVLNTESFVRSFYMLDFILRHVC